MMQRTAVDPRLRILITLAAIVAALLLRHTIILVCLATILGTAAIPAVGLRVFARRLVAVNLFAAMLILCIPWSVAGDPLFHMASLTYSKQGLLEALRIALKANLIMIIVTILVTPVDPITLGQAVSQLGAPSRLVQLYLFTLRYLRVLEEEYRQLRRAMLIRGFQARPNLHTLRAFGYLVGMLLIRALDRAERIWQAMLCRGFSGRFPATRPLRLTPADFAIGGIAIVLLAAALGADLALWGP